MSDAAATAQPERVDETESTNLRRSAFVVVSGYLVVLGVVGAGVATATSTLARWSWVFDLTSHFRMHYALALFVGAAALVGLGRRRWAAAAGVLCLANALCVLPCYLPAARPAEGATRHKGLLFNLLAANRRHDDVVAFVRAERPDFAVFLEVKERWFKELRAGLLDMPFVEAEPRQDNFGIALFSRVPIVGSRIEDIGGGGLPSIRAVLNLDGKLITVFATHPVPPMSGYYQGHRNRHLAALAELAASAEGDVMVLGDLNATPWSPHFSDLLRVSGLEDTRRGFGLQTTWPSRLVPLGIPIDHVLVSPKVRVLDRRVGPDLGSDHRPVVVEFSADSP